MDSPELEQENVAIRSNLVRLRELKSEDTKAAAQTAIDLISDTTGILFKRKGIEAGDSSLEEKAGRANYEFGGEVRVMGTPGEWHVHVINDAKGDPEQLEEARRLMQDACDQGLRDKIGEVAGRLAASEVAKFRATERLFILSGGDSSLMPDEKEKVFGPMRRELNDWKAKVFRWNAAKDADRLIEGDPAIKRLTKINMGIAFRGDNLSAGGVTN